MEYSQQIIYCLIGYILGSIPSAVWIGKLFYNTDVREHGSKNAGATNTFRVLGKKPGTIVLAADIFKGLLATIPPILFIEVDLMTPYRIFAGTFAIIGHLLPLFANFKGGKGVASSLGVIIGLHPISAGICLVVFFIFYLPSKYVSLGAIFASLAFPIVVNSLNHDASDLMIGFSMLICLSILITHRKNIRRLIKGEENKMNFFS